MLLVKIHGKRKGINKGIMELAVTAAKEIFVMVLIAFAGFIIYKKGVINEKGSKVLTSLLLTVVNPMMIIDAYQVDIDSRLMNNFLISAGLAVVSHLIGILISFAAVRKGKPDYEVERLSVVYSNCGFIGIPLINGVFGPEGVLYLTAYLTVFNICLWTHGVLQIVAGSDIRSMLKNLISPAIVCCIIGIIMFIFKIKFPEPVAKAVEDIGSMNSPLAMIIAGSTIAAADLKSALSHLRAYYIVILRHIVVPVVCVLIFIPLGFEEIVSVTAVIEAACPIAASGTMFAINYNKNALYASEMFAISTILSVITLPLIILFAEYMITVF